jgi:hypothetical protein
MCAPHEHHAEHICCKGYIKIKSITFFERGVPRNWKFVRKSGNVWEVTPEGELSSPEPISQSLQFRIKNVFFMAGGGFG